MESRVGEVVGGAYRIVAELGRGGGGVTFEAEPVAGGEHVALKELDLRGVRDWKTLELFEREARTLRGLSHPRIPRYIADFRVDAPEGPIFYLAHELVPGKTLAQRAAEGVRLNEYDVKQIAAELLRVLGFLHAHVPPLIHRDIKPENVVRREDGALFLVDFGGVRDTARTASGGSTMVGTYGYMAPEQLRGVALPATDLYGLGATLLFLLTGRSPAELPHERLRLVVHKATNLSSGLAAWLQAMLEPAPEDRFESAEEAAKALREGRGKAAKANTKRLAALLGVLGVVSVAATAFFVVSARRSHASVARGATRPVAQTTDDLKALPERPPVSKLLDSIAVLRSAPAHVSAVFDLTYSQDGKMLFTASDDGTVKAWKVADLSAVRSYPGHTARVSGVAVTPDGTTVVSSSVDGTWRTWDVATGKAGLSVTGGNTKLTRVAVSPTDGQVIATCGFDGNARTWSRATGTLLKVFPHSPGVVLLSVAFSPDGKRLVSAGEDKNIKVWDVESGALVKTLSGNALPVDRALISPDGQVTASAGDDGTLRVWRLTDDRMVHTSDLGASEVWTLAFSPPGDSIVAGTKHGRLVQWDPMTGVAKREAHDYPILAVAYAPDGETIATGLGNGVIRLYAAKPTASTTTLPTPKAGAPPSGRAVAETGPKDVIFNRAWSELDRFQMTEAAADIAELKKEDATYVPTIVLEGRFARRRVVNSGGDARTSAKASRPFVDRALALSPRLAIGLVERGWDDLYEEKSADAASDVEEARKIDPDSTAMHMLAARVEVASGDVDKAEHDDLAILDRTSDRRTLALAYQELIDIYEARHDWHACEQVHERLIALDPGSLWNFVNYASFLDSRGEYDRAVEQANAALKEDARYGLARKALAEALTHKGEKLLWDEDKASDAKPLFERAIVASPAYEPAFYGLGSYYRWYALMRHEAGAAEPSRKAFERATQLDPKDGRAANALAEHALVVAFLAKKP